MDFCNNDINKNKIDNKLQDLNIVLSKYFNNYYILIIKLYKDVEHKTNIITVDNVTILFKSYKSQSDGAEFKDDNDRIELQNPINGIYNFNLLNIESFK